ncbi:MAG: hypothetical protein ABI690_03910 [Chloroflexota bacterium]
MDVYLNEYLPSQSGDTTIVVIPSTLEYVEQMVKCHQIAYNYTPEEIGNEDLSVEKFASHLKIFPEGQFIALEVETNTVIGLTSSMRMNLDPHKPSLRSWAEITNDG